MRQTKVGASASRLKPDIRGFREYAPLPLGFRRERDLAVKAWRAGLVERPDRG